MTSDFLLKQIFKIGTSKENVVAPPDQVFVNPEFAFLITIGGHLVDDEKKYQRLMKLLREMGEDEFYFRENLGATITKATEPFEITLPVSSTFHHFDEQVKSFDPPFGFIANHFFVFGKNSQWGIYIAEFPTIKIIRCMPNFAEKFREVFNIHGNGYAKLESFIEKEFGSRKELLDKFMANYKLK